MARKLAALIPVGCAMVLFAWAKITVAQMDDAPPAFANESNPEVESEDAAGPALGPQSFANEESRPASPNHNRSRQSDYDGSAPQRRTANSSNEYRGARSQNNDDARSQAPYQNSDRSGGLDNRQNEPAQKPRSGSVPSYQRAPVSSAADSSQQNRQAMNYRDQGAQQSPEMQSSNGQPRRMQQGNSQSDNRYSQDNRYWQDSRTGNMSASYMSSGNSRQAMQAGKTSSVMANSPSENNGYGPSRTGNMNSGNGYGNSYPGNNYSGNQYSGNMYSSGPTWRNSNAGNTLPSPMPAQNAAYGRQYTSAAPPMGRQAMVTPNAVYIDANASGESIAPGRTMVGKPQSSGMPGPTSSVMGSAPAINDSGEIIGGGQQMDSDGMMDSNGPMDGGSMMGGYGGGCRGAGDGFTNPFCNNCNGGGCCGGGQCGQCGGCGNSCDDCCDDGDSCEGHQPYGRPWILAPFDWIGGELCSCHRGWWWGEDLTAFVGVENFKNITFGGVNSSFGFNEGVNWGVPVFPDFGITAQIGYEAIQSDFENPDSSRQQSFLTAGVFHRPWCDECWDAGVVFDWLHDGFFGNSFDICQVRGQVGWQWNRRNEFGFWFGTGVIESDAFRSLDQYNFFYRRQFCRGGDLRFWGGFTGSTGGFSGGQFGSDFELPISRRWAIDGGFNYFIPSDRGANGGLVQESWNLGFNLVWYVGGTAECTTPYRPLFNVADNGSLMTILR